MLLRILSKSHPHFEKHTTSILLQLGDFSQAKNLNLVIAYLDLLTLVSSVTRLGDLLDFGQLFKDFGNN